MEAFLRRLQDEAPPLARIDSVTRPKHSSKTRKRLSHRRQRSARPGRTGIPADAATCADCLRELLDPEDRRYRYPFLNCTNCGPRFTITRRIPYDRPQTSMARFKMCAAARRSTTIPPTAAFMRSPMPAGTAARALARGRRTEQRLLPQPIPSLKPFDRLLAGEIMAIKGIGGFHLAVDATNESAVMRLRERKHRYGKPLAIMVRDLEAARERLRAHARRRSSADDLRAADRACARPRRQRHRAFRRARNSLAGRFSALRAAAASALRRRPRARAGDDQRQPERRAHRDRQRRSAARGSATSPTRF